MDKTVDAKIENVSKLLKFVKSAIKDYKIPEENISKSILLCEEAIVNLIKHAKKGSKITIKDPVRRYNKVKIDIELTGEQIDFASSFNSPDTNTSFDKKLIGEDTENYIRNVIFSSYRDNLNYKYKNGVNVVEVKISLNKNTALINTLLALFAAIIFGSICSLFAPEFFNKGMLDFVLSPIIKIFLNALKLIVVPVVFFSLASCIASCGNLKQFGKIGLKLVLIYFFTAVISMALSTGISWTFNFGDPNLAHAISYDSQELINTAANSNLSLLDKLIAIVPENIVKPFMEADMLALIFLSIVLGIALSKIRDSYPILVNFFQGCDKLFITITTFIIKFMPLIVFCSFTSICLSLNSETILSLIGWLVLEMVTCLLMAIFYILYIPIRLRMSSIPFAKKMFEVFISAMTLGSSSACMPISMGACRKMGINSKVYSFAIPLGATINMNGSAIYYVITGFFMINVFGIQLDPGMLFSMFVTILLLSVATPGVNGSNLVGMLIVFAQIGVPAEAIGLVIALNPLADAFATMANVYGDLASALIVSKDLKLFNKKQYQAP